MYYELLQSICSNMKGKAPQFLLKLYIDYLKLAGEPSEKELGYGFICMGEVN